MQSLRFRHDRQAERQFKSTVEKSLQRMLAFEFPERRRQSLDLSGTKCKLCHNNKNQTKRLCRLGSAKCFHVNKLFHSSHKARSALCVFNINFFTGHLWLIGNDVSTLRWLGYCSDFINKLYFVAENRGRGDGGHKNCCKLSYNSHWRHKCWLPVHSGAAWLRETRPLTYYDQRRSRTANLISAFIIDNSSLQHISITDNLIACKL